MKLQIDTENKTIKLDEPVLLSELSDILLKIFPKSEWKEYSLMPSIVEKIIQHEYPTIYRDPSPYTTPSTGTPWWEWLPGTVSYTVDQINGKNITETVYNVEI